MRRYVLGFVFNEDKSSVALIRKAAPAWQAGKLNGVGGKIELGESSEAAMRREFREEATLDEQYWTSFCNFHDSDFTYVVMCFSRVLSFEDYAKIATATDEEIVRVNPRALPTDILETVDWLVPLAAAELPTILEITYDY